MPTDRHQTILQFLFLAFHHCIQPRGGKTQFAPLRLFIRPGKFREPDLLLLRLATDPRRQNRFWLGADLALEVVSEDKPEPITTSGGTENESQRITEDEIVVDAFDGATAQQVWHGTAQAEVDPQRINEPALQDDVRRMLTPFPRRTVE